MVVTMISASIRISKGSTCVTGLTAASLGASDSAEDVGIHQDSGESEADETKSVESLPLKRRRSQQIISKSAKKAQIAIHEESDDPGVEYNEGSDDDVINAGNGDDTVLSEDIPDLEEYDSYDGAFGDVEEAIPEHDLDDDDGLLEEEEAVPVEHVVIVPSIEDDIDYNNHNYMLNELDSYHQEWHKRIKIPLNMEAAMVLVSNLQKSSMSLEAYKKIIKWTDQYFIFNGDDADESKPPSLACVIKYLSKC